MSLELTGSQVGWVVQTLGIALVGWLLKRAINGLDESLRDIKAQLHLLDSTDKQQGRDILEQSIRLRHVEGAVARMDERHEQFGRFLQSRGFRRSDGDKGEGP